MINMYINARSRHNLRHVIQRKPSNNLSQIILQSYHVGLSRHQVPWFQASNTRDNLSYRKSISYKDSRVLAIYDHKRITRIHVSWQKYYLSLQSGKYAQLQDIDDLILSIIGLEYFILYPLQLAEHVTRVTQSLDAIGNLGCSLTCQQLATLTSSMEKISGKTIKYNLIDKISAFVRQAKAEKIDSADKVIEVFSSLRGFKSDSESKAHYLAAVTSYLKQAISSTIAKQLVLTDSTLSSIIDALSIRHGSSPVELDFVRLVIDMINSCQLSSRYESSTIGKLFTPLETLPLSTAEGLSYAGIVTSILTSASTSTDTFSCKDLRKIFFGMKGLSGESEIEISLRQQLKKVLLSQTATADFQSLIIDPSTFATICYSLSDINFSLSSTNQDYLEGIVVYLVKQGIHHVPIEGMKRSQLLRLCSSMKQMSASNLAERAFIEMIVNYLGMQPLIESLQGHDLSSILNASLVKVSLTSYPSLYTTIFRILSSHRYSTAIVGDQLTYSASNLSANEDYRLASSEIISLIHSHQRFSTDKIMSSMFLSMLTSNLEMLTTKNIGSIILSMEEIVLLADAIATVESSSYAFLKLLSFSSILIQQSIDKITFPAMPPDQIRSMMIRLIRSLSLRSDDNRFERQYLETITNVTEKLSVAATNQPSFDSLNEIQQCYDGLSSLLPGNLSAKLVKLVIDLLPRQIPSSWHITSDDMLNYLIQLSRYLPLTISSAELDVKEHQAKFASFLREAILSLKYQPSIAEIADYASTTLSTFDYTSIEERSLLDSVARRLSETADQEKMKLEDYILLLSTLKRIQEFQSREVIGYLEILSSFALHEQLFHGLRSTELVMIYQSLSPLTGLSTAECRLLDVIRNQIKKHLANSASNKLSSEEASAIAYSFRNMKGLELVDNFSCQKYLKLFVDQLSKPINQELRISTIEELTKFCLGMTFIEFDGAVGQAYLKLINEMIQRSKYPPSRLRLTNSRSIGRIIYGSKSLIASNYVDDSARSIYIQHLVDIFSRQARPSPLTNRSYETLSDAIKVKYGSYELPWLSLLHVCRGIYGLRGESRVEHALIGNLADRMEAHYYRNKMTLEQILFVIHSIQYLNGRSPAAERLIDNLIVRIQHSIVLATSAQPLYAKLEHLLRLAQSIASFSLQSSAFQRLLTLIVDSLIKLDAKSLASYKELLQPIHVTTLGHHLRNTSLQHPSAWVYIDSLAERLELSNQMRPLASKDFTETERQEIGLLIDHLTTSSDQTNSMANILTRIIA
jgi:hypothetical protein